MYDTLDTDAQIRRQSWKFSKRMHIERNGTILNKTYAHAYSKNETHYLNKQIFHTPFQTFKIEKTAIEHRLSASDK